MCGVSGGRAFLFDVISNDGIIEVCRNCYSENKLPLVKQEKSLFRGPEEQESVYERMSSISGFNKRRAKVSLPNDEDSNLRKIVEENFKKNLGSSEINPEEVGLIRNFHWVIMRVRRLKHFTQKQLAEAIEEPEIAIKYIELGRISHEGLKMLGKIENCLGINLMDEPVLPEAKLGHPQIEPEPKELISPEVMEQNLLRGKTEVDFSEIKESDLTISDLQELRKRRERHAFRNRHDF